MQAIILAAGMGRRLGDLTRRNTKCMIEVNGIRLIDRLLGQLSTLGLRRIVLVVGYEGARLREHVGTEYGGLPVEYVENPIYDKTNNIYFAGAGQGVFAAGRYAAGRIGSDFRRLAFPDASR